MATEITKKKTLEIALAVLSAAILMASCCDSNEKNTVVSKSDTVSSQVSQVTEGNDSLSTANETVSEENSSAVGTPTNCNVSKDSSELHDGVNFDDEELITKSSEFADNILSSYECGEKPDDVDNLKGTYVTVQTLDADSNEVHRININNEAATWVSVDGQYYETAEGEPAEFYEYISGFLYENGY